MEMTIELSKEQIIWLMSKLNNIENEADNEFDYLTSKEIYDHMLESLNQCSAIETLRKF